MRHRWNPLVTLAAALALSAPAAAADPWQLGVIAGARDGAEIETRPFDQDDNLDLGAIFGLSLARELGVERSIEVTWLHDEPSFVVEGAEPGAGRYGVRIDSLDVAGVYRPSSGSGRRPFVSASLGVMRFAVDRAGFDDDLRGAFTLGGGASWPLTRRTALRLTARGRLVFGDATLSGLCGGLGCSIRLQADGGFQFEADVAWLVRW